MSRQRASWRRKVVNGLAFKKCLHCQHLNPVNVRVCRHCGYGLVRPPRKRKPGRGTAEWLERERRHADDKAKECMRRARGLLNRAAYWNARAMALAVRMAKGPQPKRERRPRPVRGIKLGGEL